MIIIIKITLIDQVAQARSVAQILCYIHLERFYLASGDLVASL